MTNVNTARVGSMSPYPSSDSVSLSSAHLLTLGGINGRLWALGGDQAAMFVDLGSPVLTAEEHSACSGTADNCTLRASVWDGWGVGYTFHTSGTVLAWVDGTSAVNDYDTGFPVASSWCYLGGASGTWDGNAWALIDDSGTNYHVKVHATTSSARARAFATCISMPQFP